MWNRDCQQARGVLERQAAGNLPARHPHLEHCADCAEYAQLQRWSQQVLLAGQVEVQPPLMSAVWASIHRASEQAWDSALSRSFRYLLPYMVAVVALILLVGGLTSTRTPTPVQAASTAFAVLNQPESSTVASVVTMANLPAQDPADILGVSHRQ
ncbi:MAG TPA: hypothetical protein VMV31_12755 [Terriglobales bacterium]|nr:hypothetical protein [Terriglobales bacterium]